MNKKCAKCKLLLPIGNFWSRDNKKYLRSYCKKCEYIRNKPYIKKGGYNYSERMKAYNKEYIVRKHGLTMQDLENMLSTQNLKCAICENPIDIKTRHIDHDHKTMKVRGLLCRECNHGLGNFKDNVSFLKKAIGYLERK